MTEHADRPTAAQRIRHELTEYAIVAAYLWVCFAALAFYRSAILEDAGLVGMGLGVAAVKALILGKFMLIGHAARVGDRAAPRRPLTRIAWRSAATLLLLIVLALVEHVLEGMVHGRTPLQAFTAFTSGRWREAAAACVLLWMILVPWFGYRELTDAIGTQALRRRLLEPR